MNTLTMPSLEALANAAKELSNAAREAGDKAGMHAVDKAIYHLTLGLEVVETAGGYLVPSGTRADVVHRVSETHGCNCEAATAGRQCWHAAAVEIIEAAQYLTGATELVAEPADDTPLQPARRNVPRAVSLEKALAEINELYK